MGLDEFQDEVVDAEVKLALDDVYKRDVVQEYSFICLNCGNEMEKKTTGEYSPKTHICLECLTPHWVWPNGDSSWDDKMIVRKI